MPGLDTVSPWSSAITAGLGALGAAAAGGPSAATQKVTGSSNPIFGTDWNVNFGGQQAVTGGDKGSRGEIGGDGAPSGGFGFGGSGGGVGGMSPMVMGIAALGLVLVVWLKKKQK